MSKQEVARARAPQSTTPARTERDQMPAEIPFAYAIVEVAPGKWFSVCLEGVTAKTVTKLEPNGMPEVAGFALNRVTNAMLRRHAARKWSRA
jgi:hypothetical protein